MSENLFHTRFNTDGEVVFWLGTCDRSVTVSDVDLSPRPAWFDEILELMNFTTRISVPIASGQGVSVRPLRGVRPDPETLLRAFEILDAAVPEVSGTVVADDGLMARDTVWTVHFYRALRAYINAGRLALGLAPKINAVGGFTGNWHALMTLRTDPLLRAFKDALYAAAPAEVYLPEESTINSFVSQLVVAMLDREVALTEDDLQPVCRSLLWGNDITRATADTRDRLSEWFQELESSRHQLVVVVSDGEIGDSGVGEWSYVKIAKKFLDTAQQLRNQAPFNAGPFCLSDLPCEDFRRQLPSFPEMLSALRIADAIELPVRDNVDAYVDLIEWSQNPVEYLGAGHFQVGQEIYSCNIPDSPSVQDIVGQLYTVQVKVRTGDDPKLYDVSRERFDKDELQKIRGLLQKLAAECPEIGHRDNLITSLVEREAIDVYEFRPVVTEHYDVYLNSEDLVSETDNGMFMTLLTGPELARFLEASRQEKLSKVVDVIVPRSWARPATVELHTTVSENMSTGILSAENLLDFDFKAVIGGVTLSPAQLAELMASAASMVQMGDKWVHVDERSRNQLLRRLVSGITVDDANKPQLPPLEFGQRQGRPMDPKVVAKLNKAVLTGAQVPAKRLMSVLMAMKDGDDDNSTVEIVGERVRTLTSYLNWDDAAMAGLGSLQKPDVVALTEEDLPEELKGQRLAHQMEGIAWMLNMARLNLGFILADDMGMGKTFQLIALCAVEAARLRDNRAEDEIPDAVLQSLRPEDVRAFLEEQADKDETHRPTPWRSSSHPLGAFIAGSSGAPSKPNSKRKLQLGVEANPLDCARVLCDTYHFAPEDVVTGRYRPFTEKNAGSSRLLAPMAPVLVVCPPAVLQNWKREIEKFLPGSRVVVHHENRLKGKEFIESLADIDFVVTPFQTLCRDQDFLSLPYFWRMVIDESQIVKNPSTDAHRALTRINRQHTVVATGTPVENHAGDLWAAMNLVFPQYLGAQKTFTTEFSRPIQKDGGGEQAQALSRIVAPFILRRKKEDSGMDLPEKNLHKVYVDLTVEQAAIYREANGKFGEELAEGFRNRMAILKYITKFRQICDHPALVDKNFSELKAHGVHRSNKLVELERIARQARAEGRKMLVFSTLVEFCELIQQTLEDVYGTPINIYKGGMGQSQRERLVNEFQQPDGPPCMVVSLLAGGFGINLTEASIVVHMDRWWNPAKENQATDRAHRIGQSEDVDVYMMVTRGTIEERMDELLEVKAKVAEALIGGSDSDISKLSEEELIELVQGASNRAISLDPADVTKADVVDDVDGSFTHKNRKA